MVVCRDLAVPFPLFLLPAGPCERGQGQGQGSGQGGTSGGAGWATL